MAWTTKRVENAWLLNPSKSFTTKHIQITSNIGQALVKFVTVLDASDITHNKEKSLNNQNKRRKKALEFFRSLKEYPCADCGNRFHPCVMDFDHREGETKLFGIGRDYYKHPKEQVLAEIKKCDLVCANCHRMRTFNRRNTNEPK